MKSETEVALRTEIEALRLANSALEAQMLATAQQTEMMLRELETQRNAMRFANQKQKELSAFTQRVIDTVGNLVIVLTKEGHIRLFNQRCSHVLGLTAEQVANTTVLDDFLSVEDRQILTKSLPLLPWTVYSVLFETVQLQGSYCAEHRLLTPSGEYRYYWLEAAPLHSLQGKAEGAVISATDITVQVEIKKALRQATALAESASSAKSDFLARMSHEIRTPMNAVIGLTQLVLRTELAPKQRDYLQKVRSSSQALLGIINDILDFSKIEAGKLDLEHIHFDLRDVLDNLANVVALKMEEKNLEILFYIAPDVPYFLIGDPMRLGQVLINLVSNAVKFTDRGEVYIAIQQLSHTDDYVQLFITVRDTGIGMTEEQVGNLFQSFHQADGSISRRYGGTGLGLAIVKQLVELMHGQIKVESEFGKGTVFSFDVTFDKIADAPMQTLLTPPNLRGQPTLVVDDNETARTILQAMLESFEFEVDTVASGLEAIRILKARSEANLPPYKLILMDWNMPELDGIETARLIKNDAQIVQSPAILMVTAYGRDEVIKVAEDVGLEGFLTKPVNPSLLFNSIMATLVGGTPSKDLRHQFRQENADRLARIRGAHVLLVEDNVINRQIATEFLEQLSINVDTAEHGLEAVEKVQTQSYDLVLMDIQMPIMDGLEATRCIRALPIIGEKLPIVAMTAHAMAGDREKSLTAGMNDHLTKPINTDDLENALLRWLPIIERVFNPQPTQSERPKDRESELTLPLLHGLDSAMGVKLVGGSRRLYRKLIVEFAERHRDAAVQIRRNRQANQHEEAERLAHSIKGASGSLGATLVFDISQQLETLLHNHAPEVEIESTLTEFAAQIQPLCDAIMIFMTQSGNMTQRSSIACFPPTLVAIEPLVNQLRTLLECGDAKAEKVITQLKDGLANTPLEDKIDEIEACVDDVEFEEAIEKLCQLMNHLHEIEMS